MRAYVIAVVLVIAVGATAPPASAEGFRAEILGGWDRTQGAGQDDGILSGIGLGYDLNVGGDAFLRVDLSFDNSTMRERETGVNIATTSPAFAPDATLRRGSSRRPNIVIRTTKLKSAATKLWSVLA